MPSFSAEKPHAITCIKRDIKNCLRANCGNDLTVVCDRADCWENSEIFQYRQAINIRTVNDTVGEQIKGHRQGRKSLADFSPENKIDVCKYEARVNFEIQIYVEDCDCDPLCDDCDCISGIDKAYAVLAHVTEVLYCKQNQIAGRRIRYEGSNNSIDQRGETNIAVLIADFRVDYLLDPVNLSVVG